MTIEKNLKSGELYAVCDNDNCEASLGPMRFEDVAETVLLSNWRMNVGGKCICESCGDQIGPVEFLRRWPNPVEETGKV